MKYLLILLAHLFTTVAKLLRPGGARAVVAESLLMKQQLWSSIGPGGEHLILRPLIDSCWVSDPCFSILDVFKVLL
jgi:hypothetical protein